MIGWHKTVCLFWLLPMWWASGIAQPDEGRFVSVISDTATVHLNRHWKYHKGDNAEWAGYDFDDSRWDTINIRLYLDKIPEGAFTGICWFRQKVVIDSSLVHKPLGLVVSHLGASEIYIDGKLAHKFGKVGLTKAGERPFEPGELPIGIQFDSREHHVIAIRYSNHRYRGNYEKYDRNRAGIHITIQELNNAIAGIIYSQNMLVFVFTLLFGLLFALSFVHLLLFLFYKKHKSNLYYSLFTFFFALLFLNVALMSLVRIPAVQMLMEYSFNFLTPLFLFTLITFIYSLFYSPFPKIFRVIAGLTFLTLLFSFINISINHMMMTALAVLVVIEAVRVIIRAMIKKYRGSKILGTGVLFFTAFIAGIVIISVVRGGINLDLDGLLGILVALLLLLALLSIPISMSVYLAKDFATVNKDLEEQKENLEVRVKERTAEVVQQKETIEEKNREIIDSITYAKRIQEAILPPTRLVKEFLPDSFVLYKPKDIVSGDFYWMECVDVPVSQLADEKNQHIIESADQLILFAAVDCTGHGVPGAFVSIVGHNALDRAVNEFGLTEPAKILDKLNELVEGKLSREGSDMKDGMDIALCSFLVDSDQPTAKLEYSGANNPLWIITRDDRPELGEGYGLSTDSYRLYEVKPDKQPIGRYAERKPFTNHTIELKKGDSIYIFSDGFADQFGGPSGKKFKYKPFRELLVAITEKPMQEQRQILDETIESWRAWPDPDGVRRKLEQVDDVCVIGVRV